MPDQWEIYTIPEYEAILRYLKAKRALAQQVMIEQLHYSMQNYLIARYVVNALDALIEDVEKALK